MTEEKKLSIDYVEEITEQYKEQKEIFVNIQTKDGLEVVGLTIDKYFSPMKIKTCIRELMSKLDMLKRYIKDYNGVEELLQSWLMILLIRHFSSLEIPNDFKRQVAILDRLVETTVLFQIFAQFESSEIEKIMGHFNEVMNKVFENIEKHSEEIDRINFMDSLSQEKIKKMIKGK
jgi:hypothetical protein